MGIQNRKQRTNVSISNTVDLNIMWKTFSGGYGQQSNLGSHLNARILILCYESGKQVVAFCLFMTFPNNTYLLY